MPVYLQGPLNGEDGDPLAEAELGKWAFNPLTIDVRKFGLGVTADYTGNEITVTSGAASIADSNRDYHVELLTDTTEPFAASSGDNFVYLQFDTANSDSETVVVSDTEGLPDDPKLLLAVVDAAAETIDIRNQVPSSVATDPHGNESHDPNFASETDLASKADNPHDNTQHSTNYAADAGLTTLEGEYDAHTHDGSNSEPTNLEPDSVTNNDYNDELQSADPATGTVTVDLAQSNWWDPIAATENITVEFSNVSAGVGNSVVLYFTDGDDMGPYTITWPASVVWDGGTVVDSIPASGNLEITLLTPDGGTTWRARQSGGGFA